MAESQDNRRARARQRRLELAPLLEAGVSYREAAARFGVSVATIQRDVRAIRAAEGPSHFAEPDGPGNGPSDALGAVEGQPDDIPTLTAFVPPDALGTRAGRLAALDAMIGAWWPRAEHDRMAATQVRQLVIARDALSATDAGADAGPTAADVLAVWDAAIEMVMAMLSAFEGHYIVELSELEFTGGRSWDELKVDTRQTLTMYRRNVVALWPETEPDPTP